MLPAMGGYFMTTIRYLPNHIRVVDGVLSYHKECGFYAELVKFIEDAWNNVAVPDVLSERLETYLIRHTRVVTHEHPLSIKIKRETGRALVIIRPNRFHKIRIDCGDKDSTIENEHTSTQKKAQFRYSSLEPHKF
jgi:hypothetical protein